MSLRRQRVGIAGEKAARHYLEGKGYQIMQLNYRCSLGEIDIVAREGAAVIFVEVRTRTGTAFGTAAESVTAAKLDRLRKLARHFMQHQYGREVQGRIDLITVQMDPENLAVQNLEHIHDVTAG